MSVRPISRALFSDEPSGWWCDRCDERVDHDHEHAPRRVVFTKVNDFAPCENCGKPTCLTLDGIRVHRSCWR